MAIRDCLNRHRQAKTGSRSEERYASTRFVKVPEACLKDRSFPESGLLVLALLGKRSITKKSGEWLRSWCTLSVAEMARQLCISTKDVRAALASPYVETEGNGYRVARVAPGARWAPLSFGFLGGADDVPAVSARECLLLAVQTGRALRGAPLLDCTALAALTRTSSGRSVSPTTVQRTLRKLADRGWAPEALAAPMRRAVPVTFNTTFSSPENEVQPVKGQVSKGAAEVSALAVRQPLVTTTTPRTPVRTETEPSRALPAVPVRTGGAVVVTREREREIKHVRRMFGPLEPEVACHGLGGLLDRWIGLELAVGAPRLGYRAAAAVLRLGAGDLTRDSGRDGLVRFLRFALRRPKGCGDACCEDGILWDYPGQAPGAPCGACREWRMERATRGPESPVAAPCGPLARSRCLDCGVPFQGPEPPSGVCRACVSDRLGLHYSPGTSLLTERTTDEREGLHEVPAAEAPGAIPGNHRPADRQEAASLVVLSVLERAPAPAAPPDRHGGDPGGHGGPGGGVRPGRHREGPARPAFAGPVPGDGAPAGAVPEGVRPDVPGGAEGLRTGSDMSAPAAEAAWGGLARRLEELLGTWGAPEPDVRAQFVVRALRAEGWRVPLPPESRPPRRVEQADPSVVTSRAAAAREAMRQARETPYRPVS